MYRVPGTVVASVMLYFHNDFFRFPEPETGNDNDYRVQVMSNEAYCLTYWLLEYSQIGFLLSVGQQPTREL